MMVKQSRPTHSLRDAQRRLTRDRIVDALSELIEEEHPLDVSMTRVASRAGVSEPTLYRYFPTKRDLFGALAAMQFARATEGLAPQSVEELSEAVRTVYQRSSDVEAVIRWTLAAPDPARVPRPHGGARLAMLRRALADTTAKLPVSEAELLIRTALLLSSPMAWLYWRDYLGLDTEAAADTAAWAIQRLTTTEGPSVARTSSADPGMAQHPVE